MNVSHIPGPWIPYPQAAADHYVLLKDHNWFAAIHFNGEMMEAKQMANLQVMAAAPDLLEALKLVMSCAGDIASAPDGMLEMALDDGDMDTRQQANAFLVARAAISKATGATA